MIWLAATRGFLTRLSIAAEKHSPLRTDKYHACYANLASQMEHFIHLMYPCRKYGAFLNPQNLDFLSSQLATATEKRPQVGI